MDPFLLLDEAVEDRLATVRGREDADEHTGE
jgi:hypothetical protein